MIDYELYGQALMRVKGGETIGTVVTNLYKNRRGYRDKTTASQRAEITRMRTEFLVTHNQDKQRKQPPRLFVETTPELKRAVNTYCTEQQIPIAQFVNNAVRQALRQARNS